MDKSQGSITGHRLNRDSQKSGNSRHRRGASEWWPAHSVVPLLGLLGSQGPSQVISFFFLAQTKMSWRSLLTSQYSR